MTTFPHSSPNAATEQPAERGRRRLRWVVLGIVTSPLVLLSLYAWLREPLTPFEKQLIGTWQIEVAGQRTVILRLFEDRGLNAWIQEPGESFESLGDSDLHCWSCRKGDWKTFPRLSRVWPHLNVPMLVKSQLYDPLLNKTRSSTFTQLTWINRDNLMVAEVHLRSPTHLGRLNGEREESMSVRLRKWTRIPEDSPSLRTLEGWDSDEP
ncbi:MAG: hypothetical protein KDA80_17650 [Planctomycetaceae bacterium]|nr:hypothetical protein [Planctomycetaceae bacterium]